MILLGRIPKAVLHCVFFVIFHCWNHVLVTECNIPTDIYLFQVINEKSRIICIFFSKLAINTPERRQWQYVGSSYSEWSEICRGIPQCAILGPLLFNIFINNIFFFVEKSELCNFADDNTVYSCGKDLAKIKEDLICTMKNVLKWFMLNSLKANPGKFQFMILDEKTCYKH